jgi:hypothetical protein
MSTKAPSVRVKRRSLNRQGPLAINQSELPEGYHYHWVKGDAGRIKECKDYGYEFVTETGEGSATADKGDLGSVVSKTRHGETMYLMRLPNELWEEAQEEYKARIKEIEAQLGQKAPGLNMLDKTTYKKQLVK